jgi:hypothetical protein
MHQAMHPLQTLLQSPNTPPNSLNVLNVLNILNVRRGEGGVEWLGGPLDSAGE